MRVDCNSFVPSTIRLWNNLPLLVRNSTSLNEFKKNISGQCIKPPEYFYFGDRRAQIYHARLRLEYSSLRSHLYHKNLVESSLCSCGEFETTKHYLTECPNYHQLRNQILVEVLHLPIKTLLCGDASCSPDHNGSSFKSVQDFIILSNRFNAPS